MKGTHNKESVTVTAFSQTDLFLGWISYQFRLTQTPTDQSKAVN